MKNKISKVEKGSIAEEVSIEIGDYLLKINDNEVKDILDYKFLASDDYLVLEIEKKDGEIWEIEIEKDYDEELGLEFEESLLDKAKSCSNKCIFCFIDQLPDGMRDTLYFKDDDSRLSFLQGNFVTLTNLKDDEIERIIKYRISPINVSVHTTNPELRKKMLNNRFAGNVYERLKKFKDAGIEVNCQIVSCIGFNDKEELVKTVEDLAALYPSVRNVAVVPFGSTKYRDGLTCVPLYDEKTALDEIERISSLQKKYLKQFGTPFAWLADEFYVLAKEDVPSYEFYGGFEQLEDGIGMISLLRYNIEDTIDDLVKDRKGSFTFITGESAYEEINKIIKKIKDKNPKLDINCYKIKNNYFGETITVAGLLTGVDVINQLKDKKVNDNIIMTDNMFRKGYELSESNEQIMLDNITIQDIEKRLERKVLVISYSGEDTIKIINENTEV
ncbi:MAG: DUF512 domain-containing protein [Clostridiaceae bacterium]